MKNLNHSPQPTVKEFELNNPDYKGFQVFEPKSENGTRKVNTTSITKLVFNL